MDQKPTALTLTTTEVREAIAALIDRVELEFGEVIDLDGDYYWNVDAQSAFDLSTTPVIDTGQLTDDVESMRSMGGDGDIILWHDMEHLIGILRRIGLLARA